MVVGEFTEDVDVVILGGGPAGYGAAFELARHGRSPVVVDPRGALGGTCLFEGCIGSKSMLKSLCDDGAPIDAAMAGARSAIETLAKGLQRQADTLGVRVLGGTARFADRRTVQVAGDTVGRLRFKKAVICCGGWSDPGAGHRSPRDVLADPTVLAGTVEVKGNGADALEMAAMARALGATVHLVAEGDVMPGVPRALIKPLGRTLQRAGVVMESASEPDLIVDASMGGPDHSALDLHQTQVDVDEGGWIPVDDTMRTSDPRILAAGRCTGRSPWAGAALRMGMVAASTVLDGNDAFDGAVEPRTTWCPPGLTWCGPDDLDSLETLCVPWGHSGQAVLRGSGASGRTLLAWDPETGIVAGAGAVGEGATEHAEAFSLAVELAATLEDLALRVPAHPTCAELLGEAARMALGGHGSS